MIDNLRRSLMAPMTVAALFAGWLLPHPASLAWCTFIIAALAMPPLMPVIAGLLPRRSTVTLRSHLRAVRNDFLLAIAQTALLTTMLAYQAWLMCDAIARTLWRLFVTRRNMLEWVPADLLGNMRNTLGGFYARMSRGVLLGLALGIATWLALGELPPIAIPFLALYHFFKHRTANFGMQLEEQVTSLLSEWLLQKPAK